MYVNGDSNGHGIAALQPVCLTDNQGLEVEVLPFGATIARIRFNQQELTLGYQNISHYRKDEFYLGATIGRYANRIANGKYQFNGKNYQLNQNQNGHSLHGGRRGFSHKCWQASVKASNQMMLQYESQDGEEGYPGNLKVIQRISLVDNQLILTFNAVCDRDTPINLTNHCYFNLSTDQKSINNHRLQVLADYFLPIDEDALPTGEITSVDHGAFDLRRSREIGAVLRQPDEQLRAGNGLDHCFVTMPAENFHQCSKVLPQLQAKLSLPDNGREISVYSTMPGLQVYTGNFLTSPFMSRQAVCLEAQNWPDAPNHSHFPVAFLFAGETYQQQIIYRFS